MTQSSVFSVWPGLPSREVGQEARDVHSRSVAAGEKTYGEANRSPGRGEIFREEFRAKDRACGGPAVKNRRSGFCVFFTDFCLSL